MTFLNYVKKDIHWALLVFLNYLFYSLLFSVLKMSSGEKCVQIFNNV